ncbi:MAG: hypothetical protein LH645_12480 [Actinomycetia bacterium]|nr:hypothetical protein [Actinomycetes bacterium]
MPAKPAMPSLSSLADLPDVPGPVLAIVGAGDVAVEAARDLQAKLIAIDTSNLDLRDKDVRIDVSALDLGRFDPRKIDVAKIDPRNIDAAALTATGLLWATKGQEAYESLVARGESVVTKARSSEWSDAVADDAPVVAQPPAAKVGGAPAAKKTAAKTTKKTAAKTTKKTAAPKANPEA